MKWIIKMGEAEILSFIRKDYIPLGNRMGIQAVYKQMLDSFQKEYDALSVINPKSREILLLKHFLVDLYSQESVEYLQDLKKLIGIIWLITQNETDSVFPLYYRINHYISILYRLLNPYFLDLTRLRERVHYQPIRTNLLYFIQRILDSRQKSTYDFVSFQNRLQHSRHRDRADKLLTLISKDDLIIIYDKLATRLKAISLLRSGESIIFKKREHGLPRTISVLRKRDGEYLLILETKSKLASGVKQNIESCKGTSKIGKDAWRLDGEADSLYYNLQVPIANDSELQKVLREVIFSHQHSSPNINILEMGAIHKKRMGGSQIGLYSPKALCNLRDLMKTKLSLLQKNQLIVDIMSGVYAIHKMGDVHQDLKPENILIYQDRAGNFRAKLTDYGLSRREGQSGEAALATVGYQSPEISWFHRNSRSHYYHYYNSFSARKTLGANIFFPGRDALFIRNSPHQSNDMWALGIVFFEIKHGHLPQFTSMDDIQEIEHDSLLKGLLVGRRSERFTIEQAWNCHRDQTVDRMRAFGYR